MDRRNSEIICVLRKITGIAKLLQKEIRNTVIADTEVRRKYR